MMRKVSCPLVVKGNVFQATNNFVENDYFCSCVVKGNVFQATNNAVAHSGTLLISCQR